MAKTVHMPRMARYSRLRHARSRLNSRSGARLAPRQYSSYSGPNFSRRNASSVRIAEKYEQCADELSALATHDYAGISVLISSWLSRLLFANGSPAMTIHLCAVEASQLVTLPEPV